MGKIVNYCNDEVIEFDLIEHQDHRGYFYESYNQAVSDRIGLDFRQDSFSFSYAGVIRGLHYQWDKPMGKLVQVLKGSIIDYVLDIRFGSPTYGKVRKFMLSDKNRKAVWIPPGFAHGFEAMKESIVFYKCSELYNSKTDSAVNILDKNIDIKFANRSKDIIISNKDKNAVSLAMYGEDPKFFWKGK